MYTKTCHNCNPDLKSEQEKRKFMPEETTKRARPRKTEEPTPPRTQTLAERIVHDLTYVSDQTGHQVEAWQWVREQFDGFRNHIFNTLEGTDLPARFTQTDEYTLYFFSTREAERWANAAIARDWKDDFEFNPDAAIPEYPVGIQVKTHRHAQNSVPQLAWKFTS